MKKIFRSTRQEPRAVIDTVRLTDSLDWDRNAVYTVSYRDATGAKQTASTFGFLVDSLNRLGSKKVNLTINRSGFIIAAVPA